MTYLVVGLGNPGKEYEGTRHNIGRAVVSAMVDDAAVPLKTKADAALWSVKRGAHPVFLMKPNTFMNASGAAVAPFMKMKKVAPAWLIVVHDELDLPFGEVRVSKNSSAAGHNGVQSIIDALSTQEFTRVRIGVGRSAEIPSDKYVLARFTADEKKTLPEIIEKAKDAVEGCLLPSKN
jgi:PTH1 family peptidyl-tRNA hydrolase